MQNNFFKERAPDITALLFVTGAVFILFFGLLKGEVIATNDISTNDLLYLYFPVRFLYSEALKAGELLQWTPYIFSGYPVFAEGQSGFLYPFNFITCYLLNPIQAMNWFIIFHAMLAGMGVYFFVKLISGSGWNSIPAAVAASVCGSITNGHTRHLNILAVIALTPWLFLFAEMYARKFRVSSAMLFGSVLGLMLLTNHPQFSFICGFLAVLYLVLRFYFSSKDKVENIDNLKLSAYTKKFIIFLILAVVISIAIGYAQLSNTMQLASYSIRSADQLTSEYTGMGSLPWKGFLTFIYPYYSGNAGNGTYDSNEIYLFWEYFHYVSIIVFVLALLAIFKGFKKNNYVKIFVIISVISFLLALGENLKLYKIFSILPFVSSFRFPARWFIGTELSLIFLSAFGLKFVIDKLTLKQKPSQIKKGKKKVKGKTQPLPSGSSSGLSKLIKSKPYLPGVILSVIVIIDIYSVTGRGVATADPEIFFPKDNKNINAIKTDDFGRVFTLGDVEYNTNLYNVSKGWEGDKSLYRLAANIIPPNIGAIYHINSVGGYINLCPYYIYGVWGDQDHPGIIRKTASLKDKKFLEIKPQFIKLSQMWSVKDFISSYVLPEPFVLKSDTLGIKHYELTDVFPRAWIVKDVVSTPAENKESAGLLLDENFNPRDKAIVNGNAPQMPPNSENSTAKIIEEGNHILKIKADAPGLVVISDSWYPKWKARVNGQESEVYRVNNSMRGVVSPSAGAEIELYYDEGNLKMFLLISLLTLIAVCCYGVIDYIRVNRIQSKVS
ncbi:MAG: hypothetical protein ISS16_03795 [Ignavibacteria bacterium]|nr:hypothetical protein [Ignavibacteria bacterium]